MSMEKSVLLEQQPLKELSIGILGSFILHLLIIAVIFTLPLLDRSNRYERFQSFHVRLVDISEFKGNKASTTYRGSKTSKTAKKSYMNKPVIPVYEVKKIKIGNGSAKKVSEPSIQPLEVLKEPEPSVDQNKKSDSWKKLIPDIQPVRTGKPIKQRTRLVSSETSAEYGLTKRLYYSEVWKAIQNQWALPVELLNKKNLEAIVIIKVRRDGEIVNMRFEKKSGNPVFDESVWKAIKKANPLPPFPKIYSPPYEEFGIRFRPENLR